MAKSIKGITRIEYDGVTTRGWMVRLTRGGERQQEFFNDRTHGGKNKALAAAKQRYEEWVAAAPPIQTSKNLKSSRNTSGKVGVHMVRNVDPRWANAESYGYCAMWTDADGVRRKVSFAWNTYGKKKAWTLACLARDLETTDREAVIAQVEKDSKKGKAAGPSPKATPSKTTSAKTTAAKTTAAKTTTKTSAKAAKSLKVAKTSTKTTKGTKAAKAAPATKTSKTVKAAKAIQSKTAKGTASKSVKGTKSAKASKATKATKTKRK